MLHIVLFNPAIPPNTGNVIRLCANTGFTLHLIEPLGFDMEDKKLRRAGLDYHEWATVQVHKDWSAFVDAVRPGHVFACETTGAVRHVDARFAAGDALVFGPETGSVPEFLLQQLPSQQTLRLPMRPGQRSLNLSNAVGGGVRSVAPTGLCRRRRQLIDVGLPLRPIHVRHLCQAALTVAFAYAWQRQF